MSSPSRQACSATPPSAAGCPGPRPAARRIGQQAVVGQGQTGRTALGETAQRMQGLIEVEVGRRGGRAQHAGVGQPHPHGVAGEEDRRWPSRAGPGGAWRGPASRRWRGPGPVPPGSPRRPPARGCARPGWGRAGRRASRAAARRPGRPSRPAGWGRSGAGPPSRGRRRWPTGKARATSPTPPAWSRWMWVTATPARSSGPTPQGVQRLEQGRHRALAAGLHQHRRRSGDQVAGRHPLPPAEQGVDLDDPGGDLGRHGWPSPRSRLVTG